MTILFFSSSPLLLPPVSLLCLFCKRHDKWSRFVQLLHFFGDWIISEPDGRRGERRMHFLSTCSVRWRKRMRNGLKERQWSSQYYYNGRESRFTIRWIHLWKPTAMPLFCSYYYRVQVVVHAGEGWRKGSAEWREGGLTLSHSTLLLHTRFWPTGMTVETHNPSNRQGRTKVSVITLWRSYNYLQTTKTKQQSQKQNGRFSSPNTFILNRQKVYNSSIASWYKIRWWEKNEKGQKSKSLISKKQNLVFSSLNSLYFTFRGTSSQ